MVSRRWWIALGMVGALALPPLVKAAGDKPTAEHLALFEKKIRPVLVQHCYKCHSATSEKVRGGLVLDTREGIRKGGERGQAIVPGDAKKSLLLTAIRHTSDTLKMPPKQKLSDEVIADFEKWVALGAPDPRDGGAAPANVAIDIDKGRKFWSFQPPRKPAVPQVKDRSWARSDIDRFLLAAMET